MCMSTSLAVSKSKSQAKPNERMREAVMNTNKSPNLISLYHMKEHYYNTVQKKNQNRTKN